MRILSLVTGAVGDEGDTAPTLFIEDKKGTTWEVHELDGDVWGGVEVEVHRVGGQWTAVVGDDFEDALSFAIDTAYRTDGAE